MSKVYCNVCVPVTVGDIDMSYVLEIDLKKLGKTLQHVVVIYNV